jgi:putative ABC transport system permease protein
VIGQGMRLSASGIALGLAAALVLTRVMRSMLFGVAPTDPATFAAISAVIVGMAVAASYVPARRAMRVDPMAALRHD